MKMLAIVGEINREKVNKILEEIAELKKQGCPEVVVLISSSGGEVESGFDLYDLLKLYPGKKIGLVWQQAKSSASFILQACDVRCATPHARILIHHISRRNISLDVLRNEKKIKEVILDLEKTQLLMYRVYAARTGKTISQIRKVCEKEIDMFPEEAKEFGLIDEIWTKHFPWENADVLGKVK